MAIFNSKQLNYQRVNISSETHMVTLQVSSEITAAHGAMQSLIVVKSFLLVFQSHVQDVAREQPLPKLAPANEFEMANYMIKWYPMISNDSACTAPKINNIWSICDILPHLCAWHSSGKKQLKAGSFHVLENYADNILHSASFVLQRFFAPSTHVITLKTLLQPSTSLPGLAAKRASSMPKADLPMPWHFPLTSAGYHFTVSVKVTLESGEPMIAMAGANVWSVVFFGFVFVRCCWSRKRTANPMGGMGNTRACRRNLGWLRKIQHGDVITHPYCGDLMWDLEWSGESHLTIKGCPWSMFPSLDLSRSQCIPLCSPPLANWPCSRAQRKRDGCEETLAPGKVQTTGCTGCSCCDGTDGTVPGIHGTQA